jgi:hypothetical protein
MQPNQYDWSSTKPTGVWHLALATGGCPSKQIQPNNEKYPLIIVFGGMVEALAVACLHRGIPFTERDQF